MRKIIHVTFLITLTLNSCQSQTGKGNIEETTKKALDDLFENGSNDDVPLETLLIIPQDSGLMKNGFKEGLWIEYSVDSALSEHKIVIVTNKGSVESDITPTLQKEIGSYINSQRIGMWTLYEEMRIKTSSFWNRLTVTNYKNGLKHGEEVRYQGFGEENQTPLIVTHWKDGIEDGIGKIYYSDSPYNLQQVYNAIDGKGRVLEGYYPNEQLSVLFTDTIISKQELRYLQSFHETGWLESTGYYTKNDELTGKWTDYLENGQIKSIKNYNKGKLEGNYISYYLNNKIEFIFNYKNDKLDGDYKYYHENEQLWTHRIYKNGKLWNINSNFDSNGKRKDKGTIKNGTGTMKIYDTNGTLTGLETYINGNSQQ